MADKPPSLDDARRWFAEDLPDRSKPKLPVEESSGVYGKDPR